MSEGSSNAIKNLGWRVTLAGVGINLALGIVDRSKRRRTTRFYLAAEMELDFRK